MTENVLFYELVLFFQSCLEGLNFFTKWLWTPWESLSVFTGVTIAPIGIFTTGLIIVIIGLHIAHLVNVIAG